VSGKRDRRNVGERWAIGEAVYVQSEKPGLKLQFLQGSPYFGLQCIPISGRFATLYPAFQIAVQVFIRVQFWRVRGQMPGFGDQDRGFCFFLA
jgi:hypothetical protein